MLGPGEADEVTQDVFVRTWQKLHTFRGDAAFSTWLHRLAVNVVIERRRTYAVQRDRISDDPAALERITVPPARADLDGHVRSGHRAATRRARVRSSSSTTSRATSTERLPRCSISPAEHRNGSCIARACSCEDNWWRYDHARTHGVDRQAVGLPRRRALRPGTAGRGGARRGVCRRVRARWTSCEPSPTAHVRWRRSRRRPTCGAASPNASLPRKARDPSPAISARAAGSRLPGRS